MKRRRIIIESENERRNVVDGRITKRRKGRRGKNLKMEKRGREHKGE